MLVIPEGSLVSKYLVVHNTSELIDFFDLDPALALREKFSSIGLPFKNFLKSEFDRQKIIEILFYVKYKVETRTFPSDTKLTTNWQGRPQKYVGTHYIKSMIKGGGLVVSFQIQPTKPEYMDQVRNAIASHLGNSGIINESLTEKLKDLSKALESKVIMNRQSWSSGIGPQGPPSSLEGTSRFALQFPTLVKNTGDGKGSLLELELVDLHTVAPNFTEYKTNPYLVPILREAFAKFDDMSVAKREFKSWMDGRILPKEQREKADAFYSKLIPAVRAMTLAIAKLDVAGPASQFDAAFKAYGEGQGSDKYITELRELMKSIG
ncbi:hypothetical protein TNIN_364871 [Trichonephila inaurata madagascariensis]|uniref:Uncharacterized protein n=1 Tax=Trichonephila inaurata madagascariensis TaxID=2747483 RepID=A0A8X6IIC8_9ARAC|nr:hypothetical protein TNIN_364871 [Trichonephila inaurata madagascariensis]